MSFIEDLSEEIYRRRISTHPFMRALYAGKLSRDALKGYAIQHYHQVEMFPCQLSAIHSNTPYPEVRGILLKNILEEDLGDENTPRHPVLWLRFCKALGINEQQVLKAELLPETTSIMNQLMHIATRRSFVEGVAGLCFALESTLPEHFRRASNALNKHYGVSGEGLRFFNLHIASDEEHGDVGRQIVEKYGSSLEMQEKVWTAVRDGLNAWWLFHDGVYRAYVEKKG